MSNPNNSNTFIKLVGESFQTAASLQVANKDLNIENTDLKHRLTKLKVIIDGLSRELEQYKDMLYHVLKRPFAIKETRFNRSKKNKGNSVDGRQKHVLLCPHSSLDQASNIVKLFPPCHLLSLQISIR
jgi:regulator of replication initiation timing